MWLIDTTTFKLQFFVNADSIEYAILSHTWAEEEVLFQDMENISQASQKQGWAKIQKTCEIARKCGFKFAWVDTCCIDKTSSAELSEAINSMFSWYKSARLCFAYLSDYSLDNPSTIPNSSNTKIILNKDLGNCRWFKRGWTLQELIAPKNIIFYDRSWSKIGTKKSMGLALARITGIDLAVLQDINQLTTIHVAKRMSWAAGRQTTKVEDMSYCLFGIFDLNMPLLYGEGSKAFIRLQQEIARLTNDLTLFAWKRASNLPILEDYSGILAQSPEDFQDGARLKALSHPMIRDEIEFSSTNKGLRFDKNLVKANSKNFKLPQDLSTLDSQNLDLVLGLDCIECSTGTQDSERPRWVGVYLRSNGPIFVRLFISKFIYADFRSIWRSESSQNLLAYISYAVQEPKRPLFHHFWDDRILEIYYDANLAQICAIGKPRSLRIEPMGYFVASMYIRRRSWFLHLWHFSIDISKGVDAPCRLVLVCGLSISKSVWAAIYWEGEFLNQPNHPLAHPDVFRHEKDDGSNSVHLLTREEIQARFYEHVFSVSSNELGDFQQDLMQVRTKIRDNINPNIIHEVSLHQKEIIGDKYFSKNYITLSYRQFSSDDPTHQQP